MAAFRKGERARFDLKGSRGTYSIEATIIDATEANLTLQSANRVISIPRSAILAALPAGELKHDTSSQPKDSSGPTQADVGRKIDRILDRLSLSSASINDKLVELQAEMNTVAPLVTGAFSRSLHSSVMSATQALQSRLRDQDSTGRIELHSEFGKIARRNVPMRGSKPRPLPQALNRVLAYLISVEASSWTEFIKAHAGVPRIVAQDRITVNRGHSQEFDLPIRVHLDRNYLPIEHLELGLDKFRGLKVIGSPPRVQNLTPGDSSLLVARMRDTRKQGSRADVSIEAHVRYRVGGEHLESPRQALTIRINRMEQLDPIPNPFQSYAGGLPVENPQMFFGRGVVIEEFVNGLIGAKGGICYALYGQQRTGKSSALEQVRAQLVERGAIVASMSMGTIDRQSLTVDFVEEVLDQFRIQVDRRLPAELSAPLLARWPDKSSVEKRPLRSVIRAREAAGSMLRSAGLPSTPFVVVVDEFTYLHEILRRRGISPDENNQLRDFMRQLKGLLENRTFSALLVGQDTMPRFLASYPNEFSVMATRKLDYLSTDEAQLLADAPIRTPLGHSRYTGYALQTVAAYTDGHPFFTQILCDRIVSRANERRRADITEGDVEDAVESLLSGRDAIDAHRFDCLVTADNTNALIDSMGEEGESNERAAAQSVLTSIALVAGSQNHPVLADSLDLSLAQSSALDDLILRGVVRRTDSGVSIRVLLYSEFLRRRNRDY